MGEQEVFTHNQKQPEFVKIIDKSRRAYSISLDSTKAFEMALRKPQDRFKNCCTRFKAIVYSIWILFFKHHGKAPSP